MRCGIVEAAYLNYKHITMEIQEISRADILDILFEGRNKDYGAYQLRKTYNRRLTKALTGMASICLLLIGGYTLAGRSHASKIIPPEATEVKLSEVHNEEKTVIPPPVVKTTPPAVAMIRNTIPHVVPNDQVKPEDVPPPDESLNDVKIGTANVKGDAFDGTVTGPPSTGTGAEGVIAAPKKQDDDDHIWNKVEIESTYPAGMEAWRRFLSKTYRIPEEAISTETSGTVIVQFVVDKEGNVSDVQAVDGPEILRAEAVRVIKKSGKWTPAIQNGRQVNSYKRQPITIRLDSE
ncbi:MAG TPA: energy transducer TonB [Puia sp.]|nr:energy transducer TonB [Puia sp.]